MKTSSTIPKRRERGSTTKGQFGALKAIFNSRRHTEAEASKPMSLGYPPNAALAALNKHAADMFNPRELMVRYAKYKNIHTYIVLDLKDGSEKDDN